MNIKGFIFTILACAISCAALAIGIPEKPNPPKLVNDFAGVIDAQQARLLEDSLVSFEKHTSTQIAIVTVSDLEGYSVSDYAYQIGESWGVGQKDKRNGVVILVKPKTDDSKGEVNISTGYGLEGVLPDVTCSRIIRNNMLPYLKQNDYSSAIISGAIAVMQATQNEYSADASEEDVARNITCLGVVLFLVLLAVFAIIADGNNNGGRNGHISGGGLGDWIIINSALNSSRGDSSDWGSFSGGGGSFGGFGGFGGGSFGGGGASGSW